MRFPAAQLPGARPYSTLSRAVTKKNLEVYPVFQVCTYLIGWPRRLWLSTQSTLSRPHLLWFGNATIVQWCWCSNRHGAIACGCKPWETFSRVKFRWPRSFVLCRYIAPGMAIWAVSWAAGAQVPKQGASLCLAFEARAHNLWQSRPLYNSLKRWVAAGARFGFTQLVELPRMGTDPSDPIPVFQMEEQALRNSIGAGSAWTRVSQSPRLFRIAVLDPVLRWQLPLKPYMVWLEYGATVYLQSTLNSISILVTFVQPLHMFCFVVIFAQQPWIAL